MGKFVGHHSGISHVSSREDGHYFASNGKDNLCKLWDVRKQMSPEKKEKKSMIYLDYRFQMMNSEMQESIDQILQARLYCHNYQHTQEYQWLSAPELAEVVRMTASHNDVSLHSFTGHSVVATLIRCHFGPDSHTLYSASAFGCIHIWDIRTNQNIAVLGDD